MSYDFSQVNDKEFEVLVGDLLSAEMGVRIERFKPGKDGGVDGRFFSRDDNEIILQCKHYLKSGYSGLIRKLKKEEAQKVKRLNPEEYYLITSLPLSKKNKEEITEIFEPYIRQSSAVIGQEDLNDLLRKYPEIEKRHHKLWINSTAVLERIINNAIKGRSEFDIGRIGNQSNKYVQTDIHNEALQILNRVHVLLVSGEPGVGKTTLTENICLHFAARDFEFVDIEETLSEAENIYTRGKKQIFYFDDFLGSIFLEAITNKKDSHIIKFIERIKDDNSKRLILTSRTNILTSGIMHSSAFENYGFHQEDFLLMIKSYTRMDKAKILYNHIWFSDLPEEFIEELYKEKRYRNIVDHKNYNPRLIEFITDQKRINVRSSSYWKYVEDSLANPKDIWDDCFKRQNNDYVRNLVKLTVFNGGIISENELRKSFHLLNEMTNQRNPSHTEKDFNSMVQLAIKSFLNRNKSKNEIFYTLFNPSIGDYVIREYSSDNSNLENIYKSLCSVRSLEKLLDLKREKIIARERFKSLIIILFEYAICLEESLDYKILISSILVNEGIIMNEVLDLIEDISRNPSAIDEVTALVNLLHNYKESLNLRDYGFLICCISHRLLEDEEIIDLAEFLEVENVNYPELIKELRFQLQEILEAKLISNKRDISFAGLFHYLGNSDGEPDIEYDEKGIINLLIEFVETELEDFHPNFVQKMDLDLLDIISVLNIEEIIADMIAEDIASEMDDYLPGERAYANDIDDLFERG